MRLADARYLVDLNVLIALTDEEHEHHPAALRWFDSGGYQDWATCALTEAGFIRVMSNRRARIRSVKEATRLLGLLTVHPGHSTWPITEGWSAITSPFTNRIFGHQQVTDAYLLGMAIKENGVLVTMDRAIRHLAGPNYKQNLLVLQS